MPKTTEIDLADRTYTVEQLPMKQNAEWRKRVQDSQLLGIFNNADGIIKDVVRFFDAYEDKTMNELNLNEFVGTLMAIPSIAMRLAFGIDDVIEMVFSYSRDINKDRPYIEENAYDEEIIGAFVRMLPLAFPYTGLISVVARGGNPQPIPTNSLATNGASGRKESAPRKKT